MTLQGALLIIPTPITVKYALWQTLLLHHIMWSTLTAKSDPIPHLSDHNNYIGLGWVCQMFRIICLYMCEAILSPKQ